MAAEYVFVCDAASFDVMTGTCSAGRFELNQTGWPALSIAEAQLLAAPIAMVFVLAWCLRRLRKIA